MAVKKNDRNLFGGGGRGSDEEESAHQRKMAEKDLQDEVDRLEKDMDELRATYELFFMGVEKIEPQPQRDLIRSRLRRWQERKPRNTALKFRIQQLKARMVSLENYWQRTLRQREDGTYHRDLARLKRREAERQRQQAQAKQDAARMKRADSSVEGESIPSADLRHSGSSPSMPPSSKSLRPRATSALDLTDAKLQKLYDTYMGARRRCGESTDLRFEEMASALRKQVPKLMTKTGASSVEFKVVIRAGKAVLKALPRTGA